MNVSESKALFDLVDALGGKVDHEDYYRKVELAVAGLVVLVERARKCLGAGPTVEDVLRSVAEAGSMAHNAARTFVPIADECEDYLFWREQSEVAQ